MAYVAIELARHDLGRDMGTNFISGIAAFAILGLAPSIAPADVRDIPHRDLPGEYVVTVSHPQQSTFVDIKNVEHSADGTLAAYVYMIQPVGQDIGGKVFPFQAYLIKYNCEAGSMLLEHIDYIDGSFGLIGTMMAPADFKAWLVSEHPELATVYGFTELCQSGNSTTARIGQGEPWVALALSMRSKLSPQ
jgi:hypothetical protein